MGRSILVCTLCLALALLGVAGLHAHVPRAAAENAQSHVHAGEPTHTKVGAYLITVVDANHFDAHEHDGDVDIDPTAKAFGTLSLVKLFAAVAFLCGVVELLSRAPSLFRRLEPPLRPPKHRLHLYFLPPSHAPPATAPVR